MTIMVWMDRASSGIWGVKRKREEVVEREREREKERYNGREKIKEHE